MTRIGPFLMTWALAVAAIPSARATPERTPERVTIDGRPVAVSAGQGAPPKRSAPAVPDPERLRKRLGLTDEVSVYPTLLRDRTLVRTWRHNAQQRDESDLIDVAADGSRITRRVLPFNDRGWVPAVCGDRWLVMALESDGSAVWDIEAMRLVAHIPVRGRFGNAESDGPACSPDGKHAALPTPYGGAVTIVRLADGVVVTDIPFDGPGTVRWTDAGITIWSTFLPYE